MSPQVLRVVRKVEGRSRAMAVAAKVAVRVVRVVILNCILRYGSVGILLKVEVFRGLLGTVVRVGFGVSSRAFAPESEFRSVDAQCYNFLRCNNTKFSTKVLINYALRHVGLYRYLNLKGKNVEVRKSCIKRRIRLEAFDEMFRSLKSRR